MNRWPGGHGWHGWHEPCPEDHKMTGTIAKGLAAGAAHGAITAVAHDDLRRT